MKAGVDTVVIAIIAALIFCVGWAAEGWRKDAEISEIKRGYATETATQKEIATANLIAALKRGDGLVKELASKQNQLDQLTQEKDHEIRRLTVGRRCLDAAAVRVLNQPASLKPTGSPAPASEPVSSDAAFATDTDVGVWIGQCQRGYETCRGRLKAISDFYDQEDASE